MQTVDISGLCVHPACVVSATLTTIRAETAGSHPHPESLLLNVSGRLLMVQREHCTDTPDVVCKLLFLYLIINDFLLILFVLYSCLRVVLQQY